VAYLAFQICRTLSGEDAVECYRWGSLNLDTGTPYGIPFTLLAKVEFFLIPLTHPIPSLESIALVHLQLPVLVARPLKFIYDVTTRSDESRQASLSHGNSVDANGQGVYISGKETMEEIV
jgi:hypothetical protein